MNPVLYVCAVLTCIVISVLFVTLISLLLALSLISWLLPTDKLEPKEETDGLLLGISD